MFSVTWGTVSGWWTPACVLLGVLYAWLMYRQPVLLAVTYRYLLFAARAIIVSITAFLLISPLIRSIAYKPEKPLILIAQDNSESIKLFKPADFDPHHFVNELSALKKTLGDNYDVREFNFGRSLNNGLSYQFNQKQTNIAAAINQLNDRFVNQNIGAIVLATDGLYNQGTDPQYESRKAKSVFYSIALGDIVPKRDLLIVNVNYNKTAFLGNDFEVEVLMAAYQAKGEQMHLSVKEDGRPVLNQTIGVTTAEFKKAIPIKLNADKKGAHKFTFSIAAIKNEVSVQNNSETIYVDVIDARQKILLVYSSPHPDIAVLKRAIETNKNFEVKASLATDLGPIKPADYSLVIFYQLQAISTAFESLVTNTKVPVWYILGAQSDLQAFNNGQKAMRINASSGQIQEVFALPVAGFSAFVLSDSAQHKLEKLPPLLAPFGSYSSPVAGQVLLKQKIGSVATSYPLLLFTEEEGRRTAVLAGEGLWRWQLAEYQTFNNHHSVDELLTQTVQYLTANAQRQRFRVYPAKTVFDEGDNTIFNAELYNDALQLVNTSEVKINIKDQKNRNYSYLFTRSGQSYQLDAGILPAGEYTYKAGTTIGKEQLSASGSFSVKPLNLEARQSAANQQLLYSIAKQSGGEMLMPSQLGKLVDLIRKNDNIKTVVFEDKHYSDIIDSKWVFVLIVTLMSTEWFLRKREGEV